MNAAIPAYTTIIAPVGKQPMAVLLPILEYAPAATYLIPTAEVKDVAGAVREVASSHKLRVTILEQVDPYRPEETRDRCAELLAQIPPGQVVINLSGGTTMMALGAQRAARDHELPMLYVNTDGGEIIHLAPGGAELGRSPITSRVTIADYAAAHGAASGVQDHWSTAWADEPRWSQGLARREPYLSVARELGQLGAASAGVLEVIRANLAAGSFALPATPTDTEQRLLELLVARGLLEDGGAGPGTYRLGALPHARGFLDGHWLEVYVADACVRSGLFDEVRCSVKLSRSVKSSRDGDKARAVTNELDVVVTSRGRLAAASCKTGRELLTSGKSERERRMEVVFELGALLQADLMGLYAYKALVTHQEEAKINQVLRDHAYQGKICLISGSRLPDVARILRDHLDGTQLAL